MKGRIPPILSLWLLLVVAIAIFIGISFSKDITLFNHTLSKARFPETLMAKEEKIPEIIVNDTVAQDTIFIPKEIIQEPDTTVHSVLVFGDSMTHNLAMSIARYGTKNHYKVTGVTWESSSIPGWNNSGKIPEYIEMSQPDFVIISLGSNEMELKNFERRIPDILNIVKQLGELPYVWVGPPLWKEDKGVYAMLEKALPKEVLFKTRNMEIERGGDHVHPTRHGADQWSDSLMSWIKRSSHPILSEKPDSGTSTRGHKFIYLHPND
ncbi:MAG: hypothetical protein J1F12_03790 [Muribaculaceae bacterium]|nr:hypothetical protein [Muribaculaceae bacterium]